MGRVIHWKLCKRLKFDHIDKWYIHKIESVLKTGSGHWKSKRSPDPGHKARPNVNQQKKKKQKTCHLVDFAVPADHRVEIKDRQWRRSSWRAETWRG